MLVAGICAGLLAVPAACSSEDDAGAGGAPSPAAPGSSSATPTATLAADLPPVTDERSLLVLMREQFPASRIRQVSVESRTDDYTRSRVTYEAGDLTISGVLLAHAGFVVLHTAYRGHATSDEPVDAFDRESRLGYTRDTIHAVLALEGEPYVDPDRMAMLGRSMGGGVTLNALVAYPGLVDAA
ncbi:prolyl oligopeptidase family serine peptidase [Sporichthya sp.]|uniref:alpha/beta hydrolase family protein n=1 Tax=Sporichthya sp. TaxID=65475 RepID=UPI0025F343B3|nr:prolyl oligopeptidase family serine peptidase [Sporichthya sp.]